MGDLAVSHRLHVVGATPDRSVTLPELPGSTEHHEPLLDRIGQGLQGAWPVAAATTVGGAALGARLIGGGLLRRIGGGVAGLIGGATLGLMGLGLLRSTSPDSLPTVPAGSRAPSQDVATKERLKVMTWNLHGGQGGPGEHGSSDAEVAALAAEIERQHPDVLLLQEVDQFTTRSNWHDDLAELSDALHPDSAVGGSAGTSMFGRDQHVAVMTFNGNTITDARNIIHEDPEGDTVATRFESKLSEYLQPVQESVGIDWANTSRKHVQRNTIETMVHTKGGSDVRVLSGHYEWGHPRFDTQAREVGALADAISGWKGPTIWGGDFNVLSGSERGKMEESIMLNAGLHDVFGEADQPTRSTAVDHGPDGTGGIDHIYASDHAKVLDTHVAREAGDASDHLPVVTELELEPNTIDR